MATWTRTAVSSSRPPSVRIVPRSRTMDPKALRDLFGVLRQRSKGTLARAVFPGADLRGAHLLRADLVGADLSGAQLDHSNLEGARLSGARLNEGSLSGVS